jgi:putative tryptophan/tyrosine transport system substrate-binding protein
MRRIARLRIGRRRLLLGTGAGLVMAGLNPGSGQSAPQRIAWISVSKAADGALFLDELRGGLRDLGYAEGSDIIVETYWGEESADRTAGLVAQAIASNPRVIVAQGATALAMRRATTSIPVVFGYSGDPVEATLVDSLARPGRNLTGISYLTLELVGKRVELMAEALPGARRIAVLANPQHPGDQAERRASQAAADALGLALEYFEARNSAQLADALAAIAAAKPDAAMMFPVQTIIANRARIAEWAIAHRIPAISGWAQFAQGGNLMSYGPGLRDAVRRLAFYVDKILRGARPADLPVELPSKVELVVNLRAAKALGIAMPAALLVRADEVIE